MVAAEIVDLGVALELECEEDDNDNDVDDDDFVEWLAITGEINCDSMDTLYSMS